MIQLGSTVYTFGFLIPALGAALLGKFRYVWTTVIPGLAIGMVQSTFTKLQGDISLVPRIRRPRGSSVPHHHHRDGRARRTPPRSWQPVDVGLPAVPPARVTPLVVIAPVTLAIIGLLTLGPLWRGPIMTTVIATVLRVVVRGAHRLRPGRPRSPRWPSPGSPGSRCRSWR